LVLAELGTAQDYIRVAVFQIHSVSILAALIEKAKSGVNVEVFTLPTDSIHDEVTRAQMVAQFNQLRVHHGKVHFCAWNVGDPERTTTAFGVWYSYHGKFIVTDQVAISLSANLTNAEEIDALLVYRNEPEMIRQFNEKFDQLLELFVQERVGYSGSIRQRIQDLIPADQAQEIFSLPRVIPPGIHDRHWIRQYPPQLCPTGTQIHEGIYLIPFDVRGRNLLSLMIEEANTFVYLSAESFTDNDLPTILKRTRLKGVDVKILAGATSMDYTDRMEQATKELLSTGVHLRTTESGLHAKLVITDKLVAVSSMNLNRMNLGFRQTHNFWRENTETITVCKDSMIIHDAALKFQALFSESSDIIQILAEWAEKNVKNIFTSIFNVKSTTEAKRLLAKLLTQNQISCERNIIEIARYAVTLKIKYAVGIVSDTEVAMAIVLYHLTERKHEFRELNDKLNLILSKERLETIIEELLTRGLIVKDAEFFKINIEKLLVNTNPIQN
jgi:phosphatidylserine/phosphatidylglycerophosphate/cardiolipin synthase-like enzyme